MRQRRAATFEQPSLVPMADMLTNTVGIMLFILIFASLSAGGATIYKHLPLERTTKAEAVWMLCSGGRIVSFDPDALGKQITEGLGKPTFSNADNWAQRFAAKKFETDTLAVEGNALPALTPHAHPHTCTHPQRKLTHRMDPPL